MIESQIELENIMASRIRNECLMSIADCGWIDLVESMQMVVIRQYTVLPF